MAIQNTTRIPVLDFAFINTETNHRFSLTESKTKNSMMPSWSTSFTYSRKANAMGAGTWNLSIVDPSFTFLDILNKIYTGGQVTEAMVLDPNFMNSSFTSIGDGENFGRVEFTYGWRDGLGNEMIRGPIQGWVKKISPSIQSKFKLNVNIMGIDMNPVAMYEGFTIKPKYFTNTTLRQSLEDFLQDNQDTIGPAAVTFTDPELKDIGVNDTGFTSGSENLSFISGFLANGTLTLQSYLRYLENLLVDSGVKITFSQETDLGAFSYTLVKVSQIGAEDPPTFYVNTYDEDFKSGEGTSVQQTSDGDSPVISFDPTIEPLMPSMLGVGGMKAEVQDHDTLETKTLKLTVGQDEQAKEGSGSGTSEKPVDEEVDNDSVVSIGGGILKVKAADHFYKHASYADLEYAQLRMKYLQGWLCQMPLRASMRCQYIKDWVHPYDTVRVFVTTPSGQLFFTSGLYLVTEVSDQITPGRFITTYQMLKSGTQTLSNILPTLGKVLTDEK